MQKLNQVCYRTVELADPEKLATYESIGGYKVWRQILAEKPTPSSLISVIKAANLQGKGGSSFPTWIKLDAVAATRAAQKYVICNSDEGEPGAFKDRDILTYNPHQIIEGMAIAAYIVGASVGYNYIRGEFVAQIRVMEAALRAARKAGLLGENIFESGFNLQIYCFYGAGAYICGEETALLESMEGKRGQPRARPPLPAVAGLYGCPTLINNTETIASIPVIVEKGGYWYANLGNNASSGCKIFSISGHVKKPGNFELPLGTPFSDLLALAGGVLGDKKLKAVIPGGVSTPVLPADVMMHLPLDFAALKQAGSHLGTGSVIVMDEDTCMVKVLTRIMRFYFHESCGKCTPCREGTGWVTRLLSRLLDKSGHAGDIGLIQDVSAKIAANSLCGLGDSVPIVVASFLQHFSAEFNQAYLKSST